MIKAPNNNKNEIDVIFFTIIVTEIIIVIKIVIYAMKNSTQRLYFIIYQ